MRNGRSLVALATELERQLSTKKDLVLHSSMMHHETREEGVTHLIIDHPGGGDFAITELARRQLATKLGIPFAYFERMRSEQPQLLDRNVNTWLRRCTSRWSCRRWPSPGPPATSSTRAS